MSRNIRFTIRNQNISPAYLAQFREKFYDIEYMSPRVYKDTSRYKNVRQIQDESTGKIYHETVNQHFIDESNEDVTYVVNVETTNRLDLISQIYYTTPKYWWVIAQANYIIDPFDVPYGTILRIPELSSLYNEGGVLFG